MLSFKEYITEEVITGTCEKGYQKLFRSVCPKYTDSAINAPQMGTIKEGHVEYPVIPKEVTQRVVRYAIYLPLNQKNNLIKKFEESDQSFKDDVEKYVENLTKVASRFILDPNAVVSYAIKQQKFSDKYKIPYLEVNVKKNKEIMSAPDMFFITETKPDGTTDILKKTPRSEGPWSQEILYSEIRELMKENPDNTYIGIYA